MKVVFYIFLLFQPDWTITTIIYWVTWMCVTQFNHCHFYISVIKFPDTTFDHTFIITCYFIIVFTINSNKKTTTMLWFLHFQVLEFSAWVVIIVIIVIIFRIEVFEHFIKHFRHVLHSLFNHFF